MRCIINARIYTPDEIIESGVILINGNKIISVGKGGEIKPSLGIDVIDAKFQPVVPGFIDLQFYGCCGISLTSPDNVIEELGKLSILLPQWGVTSFLISPMSPKHDELLKFFDAIKKYRPKDIPGANMLGIHLEGPYLNPERKGAFPASWLRNPDVNEVDEYISASGGLLKIVTMSCELPDSRVVARRLVENNIRVSLGHSSADYDSALNALNSDFTLVTHCFNAMGQFHHRSPGVIGAIMDSDKCMVMLICDGLHVHSPVIRMLVKNIGIERLILATDAIPGAGLGEGTYTLLGQTITVSDGRATLLDGTIAGSILTMNQALANFTRFTDTSLKDAIKCVSLNPTRAIGIDYCKGRIAPGYDADLVILNDNLQPQMTFVGGELVFMEE